MGGGGSPQKKLTRPANKKATGDLIEASKSPSASGRAIRFIGLKKRHGRIKRTSPHQKCVFCGPFEFFGGISQDVFTPILPIYYTSILGFDKTFVGVAEGLVTASSYIFNVIAGFFSDKFKKQKPIIFIGYFLSMVSRPLLAIVTSAPAVIGLRAMDGVGKGLKDPPKDVLIAGSAEKKCGAKVLASPYAGYPGFGRRPAHSFRFALYIKGKRGALS